MVSGASVLAGVVSLNVGSRDPVLESAADGVPGETNSLL
jgi:hypothetical protein